MIQKNRQLVLKIWAHIPQVMNEPGDKTTFMKATFGTVFICDFALPHGPHPCMHPSFESSSGKFIRWNNKLFVICIFLRELTVQYIVSSRKNWKATCIRRSVWVFPLHYTTLHYITLHYTALHYITLHYITLHYTNYITLHCIAVLWVALSCITLHYIAMRYPAKHCIALQFKWNCSALRSLYMTWLKYIKTLMHQYILIP